MTTMVTFQAGGERYCVPVDSTRAVRTVDGIIMLPDPAADVTGVLPGDPPLTVISPLRSSGQHVLVIEVDGKCFGLQVDTVTGLTRIDDRDIQPPPSGQERAFVRGTLTTDGNLVLVADAEALAEQL